MTFEQKVEAFRAESFQASRILDAIENDKNITERQRMLFADFLANHAMKASCAALAIQREIEGKPEPE